MACRNISAVLKDEGKAVYAISFRTPPCAEGVANFSLIAAPFTPVSLALGNNALKFKHVGTVSTCPGADVIRRLGS
jgi:hypothetical protein